MVVASESYYTTALIVLENSVNSRLPGVEEAV